MPKKLFIVAEDTMQFPVEGDDAVIIGYIPTPPGWKCVRRNCAIDYKHTHSAWSHLVNKSA